VATADSAPATTRRYGAELEAAILDAAWDELVQIGYSRLTMGSVATRARTSEPVLYRRWPNKDRLVLAALEHYRRVHPVAVPDTGSLREDLLEQLTALTESLAGFFAIAAAAAFSGLLADTGMSPAQIRDQVMVDASPPQQRTVFRHAADRGELAVERIPAAVLAMPFDLVRHDMLLDLKPVGPERIRSIVDELFLPLLDAYRTVDARPAGARGRRDPRTARRGGA
jgi:AcrR family transcriptional regulator